MPFEKGKSGNANGRPVGRGGISSNARLDVTFEAIGGTEAFAEWATANRTEFYKLWGKTVRTDVSLGVEGILAESISGFDELLTESISRGKIPELPSVAQDGPILPADGVVTTH